MESIRKDQPETDRNFQSKAESPDVGSHELTNSKITHTHPGIAAILESIPQNVRSVLDIGCGKGLVGALCRLYREPSELLGVDIFDPYLAFCRRTRLYDGVVRSDVSKAALPFRTKSFDLVTCIEVVEHLSKQEGSRLLDEMDRVGREVLVTTPAHFFHQEFDDNPWQQHRSVWTVREFEERGYRVHGVGSRFRAGALLPLWVVASLGAWRFPRLSENYLCTKRQ